MVYQHGSPFYDEDKEECMKMHRKAFRAFPVSRVYQANIPTCSSGYWLFGFASKKYHPLNNLSLIHISVLTSETEIVEALSDGEIGTIIVEETPFYATMGGQQGDKGVIYTADGLSLIHI